MYDGGAWRRLCTKYDVRCTIAKFARVARDAEQRRRLSYEAVIGRGSKGAEADGVCLCTRYNTHDGPVQGARAAGGKCVWTARMRCPVGANRRWGGGESTSMYDCKICARCAGKLRESLCDCLRCTIWESWSHPSVSAVTYRIRCRDARPSSTFIRLSAGVCVIRCKMTPPTSNASNQHQFHPTPGNTRAS